MTLLIGAILTMGRRTVTGVLWTARSIAPGHFSSYHRVFSRASWSLWPLGKVLAIAVLRLIPQDQLGPVAGADTGAARAAGVVRVLSFPRAEPCRRSPAQDAGATGAATHGGADSLVSPAKVRVFGRRGFWFARVGAVLSPSSPSRRAGQSLSPGRQSVRSAAAAPSSHRSPAPQGKKAVFAAQGGGATPTRPT